GSLTLRSGLSCVIFTEHANLLKLRRIDFAAHRMKRCRVALNVTLRRVYLSRCNFTCEHLHDAGFPEAAFEFESRCLRGWQVQVRALIAAAIQRGPVERVSQHSCWTAKSRR